MTESTTQNNTEKNTGDTKNDTVQKDSTSKVGESVSTDKHVHSGKKVFKKNTRRIVRREDRARSEFIQKIISIRRVTRVVAGGRRFGFSVAMVLGDRKGRVGVGTGKATDTALAIEKAIRQAKKNMVKIKTTKEMSISHDIKVKYGASVIQILPAKGRGLVAGKIGRAHV